VIFVGIDPGSKVTGICTMAGSKVTVGVACPEGANARVRALDAASAIRNAITAQMGWVGRTDTVVICVEWQEWRKGKEKNPQAILDVQAYSGLCIAMARMAYSCFPDIRLFTPSPSQWKGQVAKANHTPLLRQQYQAMGGNGLNKIPRAQQSDALDAFGLACWAQQQMKLGSVVDQWKD
jgi:Holliday junction resolvasome RuvABC endonuclease subunit